MKPFISNHAKALTYLLEDMYDAEKKIQKNLPALESLITSSKLKSEVGKYHESAGDKRIKLKRIFSYLLVGRFGRENEAIHELLKESRVLGKVTVPSDLRDRMIIVSLQEINQCKIAVYEAALVLADQMNLVTVTELLEEILNWERETSSSFSRIGLQQLSKKTPQVSLQN